jgi:hypothetical protein
MEVAKYNYIIISGMAKYNYTIISGMARKMAWGECGRENLLIPRGKVLVP